MFSMVRVQTPSLGLPTLYITLSHIPSLQSFSPARSSSESHTVETVAVSATGPTADGLISVLVSVLNPIFYMLRAKNNTCCSVGENSTLLSGFSLTASSTFLRLTVLASLFIILLFLKMRNSPL